MTGLVFLDTETTSLRPDRRAWEIAMIVRRDGHPDWERNWFVSVEDLDLGNADLGALKIGRFHERHPEYAGRDHLANDETYILAQIEALTRGATIVGAVPSFDAELLATRMRARGMCPSWRHRLLDIESFAAGALRLRTTLPGLGDLLEAYGLKYDEADRHTALGDARMVRDLYDAVLAVRDATVPA